MSLLKGALTLLIYVTTTNAFGQTIDSTNFRKGIYFEEKALFIPWKNENADKINSFPPSLIEQNKKYIVVKWQNIIMFQGLKILSLESSIFNYEKPDLVYLRLVPDSSYPLTIVKEHLETFLKKKGKKKKMGAFGKTRKSNDFFYKWKVYNCRIDLYDRNGKSCYILIEKRQFL